MGSLLYLRLYRQLVVKLVWLMFESVRLSPQAGAATFVVAAFLWGGIINRIGRVRSVIIGMSSYAMTITLTGFVLQEALG